MDGRMECLFSLAVTILQVTKLLASHAPLGADLILHGFVDKVSTMATMRQFKQKYMFLYPNRLEWRKDCEQKPGKNPSNTQLSYRCSAKCFDFIIKLCSSPLCICTLAKNDGVETIYSCAHRKCEGHWPLKILAWRITWRITVSLGNSLGFIDHCSTPHNTIILE